MTYETDVRDAIARRDFRYLRCACRVHKTLPYYVVPRGGRCGACGEACVPATQEEYEAQEYKVQSRERAS
jgi:hypothetical protein